MLSTARSARFSALLTFRSLPLAAVVIAIAAAASISACDEEEAEPGAEQAPELPSLGALELPISLRSGGAAPSDAAEIELTPSGITVGGKPLLALEGGKVPESERTDGVIGKVKQALAGTGKKTLSLAAHSGVSYETVALVLHSAHEAGQRKLALKVRKAGDGTDTGYLQLQGFTMTPRTHGEVPLESVDALGWDEFAGAWQQVYDGCRGGETGSCAYVQESVAKGGDLKIVLHTAGQGVAVNFYRVGVSAEQLEQEAKALEAERAKKREDIIQGRAEESELEAELLGAPASEALFQFRAREALSDPSPVTATIAPVCGKRACGAVVSADPQTLLVRVVSLIGAAFPDGTPPPTLAFEMPWTPAPKVEQPAAE